MHGLPRQGPGTRASVARASAAVMQQVDERLILTADAEVNQDPDPARRTWPGALLVGAIWTARPGLDLDVGCQRSRWSASGWRA